LWLPKYNEHFGQLAEEVNSALLAISPATIDRILKPVRIQYQKRGKSTTKPGTLQRKQIPISTNQWDESRPGFLEADIVAHCGGSLQGMFTYTIDFVDIATGWTEQRTAWGKGEKGVLLQGDLCDERSENFAIAEFRFKTIRVFKGQNSFLKAFHRKCNGSSTGDRIKAVHVAKVVCLAQVRQICIAAVRAKGCQGLIFRASIFRLCLYFYFNHWFAPYGAAKAGISFFKDRHCDRCAYDFFRTFHNAPGLVVDWHKALRHMKIHHTGCSVFGGVHHDRIGGYSFFHIQGHPLKDTCQEKIIKK
jgi:hypothetical protein